MNPIETETQTVFEGVLDYDPDAERMLESGIEPHFHITEVYQSQFMAKLDVAFSNRHTNMQAEADEHFNILVMLQKVDAEFDQQLRMNFFKKREAYEILAMSENWKRFSKTIKTSMYQ